MNVSVIIPCYNAAPWVADTIRAVLAQTIRPLEILAVDDGSTDDTAAVLSTFGNQIRVVTQPNRGLGGARNAGARAAKGDWLAFLDADDLYLPSALSVYFDLHRRFPEAGVLFGDFQEFDRDGLLRQSSAQQFLPDIAAIADQTDGNDFLFEPPVELLVARNGAFTPSCFVVRRDIFLKAGEFDETRATHGAEDLDLYFRIAPTEQVAFANHVIVHKRRHSANMSHDNAKMRSAAEQALGRAARLYKQRHPHLLSIVTRKKLRLLAGWAKADVRERRPTAMTTVRELARAAPLLPSVWMLVAQVLAQRLRSRTRGNVLR